MIKDQHSALREASKFLPAIINFRFENERDADGKIVATVDQDIPLTMTGRRPTGMMTGIYVPGRMPGNPFDHRQMRKDWNVIRSYVRPEEVVLDPWPPMGVPIIVMVQGMSEPKAGVVVEHIRTIHGNKETKDLVFAELADPQHSSGLGVSIDLLVRDRQGLGPTKTMPFHPHDMNSVIAWSYMSVDNQLIPPHRDEMLELFVDCEFEDSTKTLISMALVTRDGHVYYAFDSEAAEKVKDEWVQSNVLNVLMDVPPNTHVIDLVSKRNDPSHPIQTFQDFVSWVIKLNTNQSWLDPEMVIHADFPTDIGYLAPLFHLGGGERIRPMSQVSFIVDYIDSYPTGLKAAVQHNAAWDALAMWLHMGYTAYLDPRKLADSSIRNSAHELKAPDERDFTNTWTDGTKGILEKGPSK